MKYYQNDNCLVNLANSILKRYTGNTFHNTIPEIDKALKNAKKTVLFLFDGMGEKILEKHLAKDSFLRSHKIWNISSTFPPTTVAATTAVKTGKYPLETGWLAWSMRYKDEGLNKDVFINRNSQTKEELTTPSHFIIEPYDSIPSLINKHYKKDIAYILEPYPICKDKNSVKTLKGFFTRAAKLANKNEESFIYAYWPSPDDYMHLLGTKKAKIRNIICKINKDLEDFHNKNKDINIIVISDHGMIDALYLNNMEEDHPDLAKLRDGYSYFEKRSVAFNVKNGCESQFKDLFLKYYSDHFDIYDRSEIIDKEFFGPINDQSIKHYKYLPNFICLSKDRYSLYDFSGASLYPGHHGGISLDEFSIDVHFIKGE